ncbi:MAG: hypothetical protein K2Y22_06305 [Candidatus Obscuribacterales bacterium]|nr:hypothetical protein [Candidatus Obscuribacterales bacterium]
MEINNNFLVAGFIAGGLLAFAVLTQGSARKSFFFLIAGTVFGVVFHDLKFEGREGMAMLAALFTGLLVVAVPFILHAEKKEEDAARERRTTPGKDTLATLNRIFRSPPAEK